MKEHPILFSTEMVQAILEGRKSQTRRFIKPSRHQKVAGYRINSNLDGTAKWPENIDADERGLSGDINLKCPYGKIGDTLWVRETFVANHDYFIYRAEGAENWIDENWDDDGKIKWKPNIFMPKKACRIFLEVTDIRVERLQDISEEDAAKEGVIYPEYLDGHKDKYRQGYKTLWQSINGEASWKENPFVWVVSFKRIQK